MIQLLKQDQYRLVAAFYMEQSSSPGVISAFKRHLAKLYGIPSFHSNDREQKRREFWERALSLENMTEDQKHVLSHLNDGDGEERRFTVATYEILEKLGLIQLSNGGAWDYTEEGEAWYYKLKSPANV
jgi:hypothetical protein